jgi:hypothetical protein
MIHRLSAAELLLDGCYALRVQSKYWMLSCNLQSENIRCIAAFPHWVFTSTDRLTSRAQMDEVFEELVTDACAALVRLVKLIPAR